MTQGQLEQTDRAYWFQELARVQVRVEHLEHCCYREARAFALEPWPAEMLEEDPLIAARGYFRCDTTVPHCCMATIDGLPRDAHWATLVLRRGGFTFLEPADYQI